MAAEDGSRLAAFEGEFEFLRSAIYLHRLNSPVRIVFEAARKYDRRFAHLLKAEGCHLELGLKQMSRTGASFVFVPELCMLRASGPRANEAISITTPASELDPRLKATVVDQLFRTVSRALSRGWCWQLTPGTRARTHPLKEAGTKGRVRQLSIGFLHIDLEEVCNEERKLYPLLVINRTSKFVVVELVEGVEMQVHQVLRPSPSSDFPFQN